jgi:hypothetical protein
MVSGFQCCFCGEPISDNDLVDLVVYPSRDKDESQQIFCHKKCLRKNIQDFVPLHADLED